MRTSSELLKEVLSKVSLSELEEKHLCALVDAWETSQETVAQIEPDGSHAEDEALLKIYEPQDTLYAELYDSAPDAVITAFDMYLDLRNDR